MDDRDLDILLNEEWGIDAFFDNESFVNVAQKSGRILNLQPVLEADPGWELDDFNPSVLVRFQHTGNLWGIPTEFVPLVMFYNKDLFDEAGVAYPSSLPPYGGDERGGWTKDDFLATAVALKAALPERDFAFAGGTEAAVPFIYTHGGSLLDEEGNCTLDDPLTIEALRWYFDLALVHEVMPTLAQVEAYEPELQPKESVMVGIYGDGELGEGERRSMEADGWLSLAAGWGDAALWVAPLWEQGGWQQTPWKFRWGVAPLPRDAAEVTMLDTFGCYVTAHSQHPQEALRWIEYLTRHRVDISGIPARRSVATGTAFREALSQEIDGQALDDLLLQIEQGQPIRFITIRSITIEKVAAHCLGDALVDIYERGADVETALRQAQQRLSEQ